jgi:hypothetical protein
MKTFLIALAMAFLITGQFFTPVAAVHLSAGLASENRSEPNTIQPQDVPPNPPDTPYYTIYPPGPPYYPIYVPISSGTSSNPVYNQPYPYYDNYSYNPPYYAYTPNSGYAARVRLSTTRAKAGQDVTVYVSGFPPEEAIEYFLVLHNGDISVVYDGVVASDGTTSETVTIPSSAWAGQYWTVRVYTTQLEHMVQVYSRSIFIIK